MDCEMNFDLGSGQQSGPVSTAPDAPTDFTATGGAEETAFTWVAPVAWNDGPAGRGGADRYFRIEEETSPDVWETVLDEIAAGSDNTTNPATVGEHNYRIVAVNDAALESVSNEDTATVAAAPLSFSDDFNRANGAVGNDWIEFADGAGIPLIGGNEIDAWNDKSGTFWRPNDLAGYTSIAQGMRIDAIYSSGDSWLPFNAEANTSMHGCVSPFYGTTARMQNGYVLECNGTTAQFYKVVNGTPSTMGTSFSVSGGGVKVDVVWSYDGAGEVTLEAFVDDVSTKVVTDNSTPFSTIRRGGMGGGGAGGEGVELDNYTLDAS